MPPKKGRIDWSWISDIDDASQITDEHRLRAAGLKDLAGCSYAYSSDLLEDPAAKDKDKSCTRRRCEADPACLNHVGVMGLMDRKKGKEKYLEDRLPPVQMRKVITRDLNGSNSALRDDVMGGSKMGESASTAGGGSSKVTLGMMPAGLRNLGATCYANAFLQLWFYNVAFRNAIYSCSPMPGSPLFHLAYIFASLQYSPRSFVDPTSLIEALRLDKTDQQDAGEFSKLFLDLISAELSKQKDARLRTFTKDLFEGRKEIIIKCDCGYQSPRSEEFLELEIPLKDGETLLDRLRYSLASEKLDGPNQYNCPSCNSKRDAIRSTKLTHLPPMLHFTLVRFAYDLKAQERRKSKANIKFSRLVELEGHEYHLQAIVAHRGPNAHQGHFVCEALDEAAGCWWMCDDEDVSRISRTVRTNSWHQGLNGDAIGTFDGAPPAKRARKGSSEMASRDAYMLVFSRTPPTSPIEPPPEIMAKLEGEFAQWQDEMGNIQRKKYVLEEEYDAVTAAKRQVAAILPGNDRLLPTTELERWFAADTVARLYGPWTIPTCPHGAISHDTTHDFKLISQAAFDELATYCTGPAEASGSPMKQDDRSRSTSSLAPKSVSYINLPELGICPECISDSYSAKTVRSIELTAEQRSAWLAEVKADRALIKKSLDQKPIMYTTDYFYLPTSFVKQWTEYAKEPMADRPVLDASLGRCEHGFLDVDLANDQTHYISSYGWIELMKMYGQAMPIVFHFKGAVAPEKRFPKYDPSVPTCTPCRTKKLLDFEQADIMLVMERTTGLSSRRSKGREAAFTITKSTKMVDIKVHVMDESGLTPAYQVLSHNGRELDNDETIESAGVLAGDTIICKEVVVEDLTHEDDVMEERGFGGTALRGRQACPDCTFENDSGATACEVCQRPFGFN